MKKKRNAAAEVTQAFVFIEVPILLVWPEVKAWGAASWWPSQSAMTFRRAKGSEPVESHGLISEQRLKVFPWWRWRSEITRLEEHTCFERTYLNGPMQGSREVVTVEERVNGTRVDYMFEARMKGPLQRLLWRWILCKRHAKNIQQVLQALKTGMDLRQKQEQEQRFEKGEA